MDLIERADVIKAVRESKPWHFNEIVLVLSAIKDIPSAEKQGEWVFDDKGYFSCSECGRKPKYQINTSDFCPNCGARMKGADDA